MNHRHLTHSDYTPAAIDSVIERGRVFPDWRDLCRAALADAEVLGSLERLSKARAMRDDPENFQRHLHERWWRWCEMQRAIDELAERGGLTALPRRELRRIVKLQEQHGVRKRGE